MKRFLVALFIILIVGFFTLIIAGIIGGAYYIYESKSVASKTILEIDFEKGVVEYAPPSDPISELFMKDAQTLRGIVDGLNVAAKDDRVVGLIARTGAVPIGLAQMQEIRDAIEIFKKSGKFTVAYSETMGEVGSDRGSYYLASAFDEVYLQPSGDIGLTGLYAESMFIRGALDKLNVVPRMDHRYEYKNAMNMFTEKEFTAAHEESLKKVLDSVYGQMLRSISASRKITEEELRKTIDRGPLLGKEALDAKLVDGLEYREAVYQKVKSRAGDDAKLMYVQKYINRVDRPYTSGETIALIYGLGAVQRGKNTYNPLSGEMVMGSDSVTKAFREAIEDPDVKAIVFRVDSPGGSYVASDAIWKETVRAKDAGKPVIVTMGNVAGSGGYFVAMAADKIVAEPGTITGSIGVLGGKFLTTALWDRVGITYDSIQTNENSSMWSSHADYTEYGWKRFQAWLDRVYLDFTTKVAEGRKMTQEQVHQIAKGRIWSGEDAKSIGLVDELGGFDLAVELAKQAAGISKEEDIELKSYPKPRKVWEQILDPSGENSETEVMTEMIKNIVQTIQPAVRLLQESGLIGSSGELSMEPVTIR